MKYIYVECNNLVNNNKNKYIEYIQVLNASSNRKVHIELNA